MISEFDFASSLSAVDLPNDFLFPTIPHSCMIHSISSSKIIFLLKLSFLPYRGMIWGTTGLLVFLFAQVKTTFFISGLLILAIGEIFRIWGVGYIKNYRGPMFEVAELTTAGPYAFVLYCT